MPRYVPYREPLTRKFSADFILSFAQIRQCTFGVYAAGLGNKIKMMANLNEERVYWREKFFGERFDFRSRILFLRFDACLFVDCTIMFDAATEQLAFTNCIFKDCNVDQIEADEARGLIARDNFFDRPLRERKEAFDAQLAEVLRARTKT